MVNACLAADAGVHLGDQRRRHLHEGDAPQINRCGEPGQIADHAPSQRNEPGLALVSAPEECVEDHGDRLERLGPLPVREGQHRRFQADRPQAMDDPGSVMSLDNGVRDDDRLGPQLKRHEELSDAIEQSILDYDFVAVLG